MPSPVHCGHCLWDDHGRCATRHQLPCACEAAGHNADPEARNLYQHPEQYISERPARRYRVRIRPVTQ